MPRAARGHVQLSFLSPLGTWNSFLGERCYPQQLHVSYYLFYLNSKHFKLYKVSTMLKSVRRQESLIQMGNIYKLYLLFSITLKTYLQFVVIQNVLPNNLLFQLILRNSIFNQPD